MNKQFQFTKKQIKEFSITKEKIKKSYIGLVIPFNTSAEVIYKTKSYFNCYLEHFGYRFIFLTNKLGIIVPKDNPEQLKLICIKDEVKHIIGKQGKNIKLIIKYNFDNKTKIDIENITNVLYYTLYCDFVDEVLYPIASDLSKIIEDFDEKYKTYNYWG